MSSFSRSSRPSMAKKLYCDSFYQIPQTKSKRKASIGYGKKIDWDDLNKTKKDIPPPTAYNPQDFIAVNKSTRKGFTAGIGRQETKSQSFIQFDKSVPGPQKYHVHNAEHEGPKYSMRPRTASQTFVKKSSKLVPGPGKYKPVDSINPEGRYCISKWESSKSKRFDPTSSSRFMKTKTQVPGPGEYTPRNSAWENGNLAESKYVSQGNRVFATGNRSTIFEDEPKKFKDIPGPGMYEPFSGFGSIMETPGRKTNRILRPASSKIH